MGLISYSEMIEGWAEHVKQGTCSFNEAVRTVARRMDVSGVIVELDMVQVLGVNVTPEYRIATLIHSLLCHASHSEGCYWYEESWLNPGSSRKYYIQWANKLLAVATYDEIKRVLEAIVR